MLELAERAARVMVRDVIVIVGVHGRRMGMLVLKVADDVPCGLALDHSHLHEGPAILQR